MTTTSASRSPSLVRPDGQPVRVLVVDDEPNLADLLTMALRYEGWEIRTAHDGLSAVRLAREFRPDAVVLDVMLPDLNGLDVLRRLRGQQAGNSSSSEIASWVQSHFRTVSVGGITLYDLTQPAS